MTTPTRIAIADALSSDPLLGALVHAVESARADEPRQLLAITDLAVRHHLAEAVWRIGGTAQAGNVPRVLCSRFSRLTGAKVPDHLRRWSEDVRWAAGQSDLGAVAPFAVPDACATHIHELRKFILDALRGRVA